MQADLSSGQAVELEEFVLTNTNLYIIYTKILFLI